ncbi:MAG: inositol monophosphatase [Chloroflexi bacterium]|nr:inositol monophosphatase [Chloroflexota bacterium]
MLNTATSIALEAGALLYDGFTAQKQIERKSTAIDLVTQYDTATEKLIVDKLTAVYPDHNIIGEEGANRLNGSPYTWYIDPIDGTNNFAHGFPVFCVSMALYEANRPLVGVVYDPMRDECFTAVSGGGAFLTSRGNTELLTVSKNEQLVDSLLATGFPYDRHTSTLNNVEQTAAFLQTAQGIRRPGSAALDLAYVAAGRLDGYWEFKLNSWDVAAAALFVLEAGGAITTILGEPLKMQPKLDLVVSNGRIHTQMLRVLETVPAYT